MVAVTISGLSARGRESYEGNVEVNHVTKQQPATSQDQVTLGDNSQGGKGEVDAPVVSFAARACAMLRIEQLLQEASLVSTASGAAAAAKEQVCALWSCSAC